MGERRREAEKRKKEIPYKKACEGQRVRRGYTVV